MIYNNLFEIIDTSLDINIKNISENIIIIKVNKNNLMENNIFLKFKNNINLNFIIGFSINLKYINLICQNKISKIETITEININTNSDTNSDTNKDNILEIQPKKSNKTYEIYINILNFKNTENKLKNQHKKVNLKIITNPIKNKHIKKIIIILTQCIKSIGEYFKLIFEKQNISCELKYSLEIVDCLESYNKNDTIYLILFSKHKHNLLPKRVIFYQIEQFESKFLSDPNYFNKFKYIGKKAEKIWEYSNSASKLYKKYFSNRLEWKPMPFVIEENIQSSNFDSCEYDIFFYGHKNSRREKILLELSKTFNIIIGFGCYGIEKFNLISKSKIILNIHYYKNAGLETCRINEILNYNKIILSEKSSIDINNMNLYKEIIEFVDEIDDNLSNIHLIIQIIKFYLNKENYINKIESNKNKIKLLEKKINDIYSDNL